MEERQLSFSYEQQRAFHDYLRWLEWAKDNGVVTNALLSYYRDSGAPLYRLMVNGREVVLPIMTRRDWVGLHGPMNRFIGTVSEDQYVDHDKEAIEGIAKEMYVRQNGTRRRGEPSFFDIGDVVWNGKTYRITDMDSHGSPVVDVQQSDFFSYLSKSEHLLRELHHVLQKENMTEDEALRTDLSHQLPSRNKYAKTFDDLTTWSNHVHKIGPACLLAIEQERGSPVIYYVHRSKNVLHEPNTVSVVPAGEADPDKDENADLEQTIVREMCEELLGIHSSVDPDRPGTEELMEQVNRHAEQGHISITRTGFGFTLGAPRPCFTGVVHVSDTELGQWMIDKIETNWEIDELHRLQLPLRDLPSEFVPPRVSPTGGMAFFEGLMALERDGVRTGLEISHLF